MLNKIPFILFVILMPLSGLFALEQKCNNKIDDFDFLKIVKLAEIEAKKNYEPREIKIPKTIATLTYSQYNLMRYNIDHDLWGKENLPFRVSFFPLGTPLYSKSLDIYEVTPENLVKPVPFSPEFFCYEEKVQFIKKEMPNNAGYAGFKLRYKAESSEYPDEFAAFLGGCYFRVVSDGSSYGLSNRGIAINTGLEKTSEEFPTFEKIWLKKTEKNSKEVTIYAYLNGPSITGAYSFTIRPGKKTEINVKSTIFLRQKVKLLGLAPITSMFWFSEGKMHNFYDYRPSVHNSEGLVVSEKNRKTWEPLVNYPDHKMINDDMYCQSTPNFFGLIQRNREYNFYMDPSVKYHLNPNCWIIPENNWGSGNIRLFILPTLTEWMDNINAFWVPENTPEVGKPFEFNYKIIYSLEEPERTSAYVKYTNVGLDLNDAKNTVFALSYDDALGEIEKNCSEIKIKLETPKEVKIISIPSIEKISFNNTWRVIFTLTSKKLDYSDKPHIIKVTLLVKDNPISETWYYQWYP